MKPSEIVRKAIDILDEHPWAKGAMYDPSDRSLCAEGALVCAMYGDYDTLVSYHGGIPTEHVVGWNQIVNAFRKRHHIGIASYNDHNALTVDEVQHALKLLAEDLELEGR